MPIVRQLVDERYSATAYGFLNLVGCITGGVMTYVGGSLRDAKLSLSIAFVICAVAILITSGRCFMLKPHRPFICHVWNSPASIPCDADNCPPASGE